MYRNGKMKFNAAIRIRPRISIDIMYTTAIQFYFYSINEDRHKNDGDISILIIAFVQTCMNIAKTATICNL